MMTPARILFLIGSLAGSLLAQPADVTALSSPFFVEIAAGEWRAFPSAGAPFAADDRGLRLRSRDGERALSLSLPSGWRVRAGEPVATRVHLIRSLPGRELAAAASLVFEDPAGMGRLELRAESTGSLGLAWDLAPGADVSSARLTTRGIPDHEGLVEALARSSSGEGLRWVPDAGGAGHRLALQSAEGGAVGVLVQQLVFGTYLGGSVSEQIRDLATDASGRLVIGAWSNSLDFPTLAGAYDPTADAAADVAVLGLTSDGSTLEFATFFGGSSVETLDSLAVSPDGSLVIAGLTWSTDLPVTPGAFDETWNGGDEDSFVARLSADGTALLACTYLGGSGIGADRISDMALDPRDGTPVVTGRTCSPDWPTTPGSLQPDYGGSCDAFLTRLSADLSSLVASTHVGGPGTSFAGHFGILPDGSCLVAGLADGDFSFPLTLQGRGAFPDATEDDPFFLVRVSADFSDVVWSTRTSGAFLGGHPRPDGSIVMVGSTRDADFPTTPGAYSQEYTGFPGMDTELVALALSEDGTELVWSTFITSNGGIFFPGASAVDEQGRIFFAGSTFAFEYPYTPDAFDTELTGLSESHLTVLDPTGSEVLYASLLGVPHGPQTGLAALTLDHCGGAYVSSKTNKQDFPTTPGALQEVYNGGTSDAWLLRITAINPWTHLGAALPGVKGRPELGASGPLCAGDPTSLDIIKGPDLGTAFLVLGLSELGAPLKGGTLVPAPDFVKPLALDANGARTLAFPWPAGTPSGLQLWLQAWMPDPAAPLGFSATNGALATVP